MNLLTRTLFFILSIALASPLIAGENSASVNSQPVPDSGIAMTSEQRQAAGIRLEKIGQRMLYETISAPGRVLSNLYRTADATALIQGIVARRMARMGEYVKKGQALVTLISPDLARAQAAYLAALAERYRAKQEYVRLKGLAAQQIVSKARLQRAGANFEAANAGLRQARAALSAYGLSAGEIESLARDKHPKFGRLVLRAPLAGTVVADHFRLGENIAPGRMLMQITNESTVWVEASMTPENADRVRMGMPARIGFENKWLNGKVVQLHHRIDPVTRTRGVRIEVDNRNDLLHQGQFVDVRIRLSTGKKVSAVPAKAVILMQGSPIVFKQEDGQLRVRKVKTGASMGGWTEIKSGLTPGDMIVSKGAFLLKSMLLKSQLGED